MDDFLTPAQLIRLTGYERAADQIKWLRAKGIYFWVNSKNAPAVPWSSVSRVRAETAELGEVR